MADELALPKSGDIVAGKYRIERPIGMGGMGAVFEATHRVTGKRFALKWLLPSASASDDAAKRFIREAQVAGRFEHPNVVEVYDVGQERGSFYMVMALLEGESLAARLERAGRLEVEEILRILIPCMRGVARAHAAGIVHRDLKPANLFLCRATDDSAEHPKVLDFGISKMSNVAGEVDSSLTKTGMVMGTPHYMSPEQLRGVGIDHRADIYAFGVILYQLLSGELPFPADSFSALVLQIGIETPKALDKLVPGLPAGLTQIVERAMARDAADRFAQLDALVRALEPFGTGKAVSSIPAPRRSPEVLQPPSRSTLALDTPLATESEVSLPIPRPKKRGLMWAVGGAAIAVVTLGVVLAKLLPSTGDDAAAASRAKALRDGIARGASLPEHVADASTGDQLGHGDAPDEADEPHPLTVPDPNEPAPPVPAAQPLLGQPSGRTPNVQPPPTNAPAPSLSRPKPSRPKPAPSRPAREPLGF